MSSTLQSFDGPTGIFADLTKLVEQTKDSSNNPENAKYAKLGQKYLSAIVTEILLFRLETPVQDTDMLIDSNISKMIDSRYYKGECLEKLEIGLGRMFHERNMERAKKVEQDIQSFFQLQFANEQSYSKFIFEVSISKIQNKLGNNILDDSEQFHPFSDIRSVGVNEKSFEKMQKIEGMEKHIKEVENYLKEKNGTTELNLLKDFKRNTIIPKDNSTMVGALTRHTVELEFINFLDDSQIVKLTATDEGMNKQTARQKASKLMLRKFFTEHPYVFKDYLHCMKVKGK